MKHLTVRTLRSTDELRALAPVWSELCAEGANELAQHPLWQLNWWDTFGGSDRRRPHVMVAYDGARLVGLAPLLRRPTRYRRLVPIRRIELIGSGEDEADEICSDYNGILCAPGYEDRVIDALLDELTGNSAWEHLVLHGLDGSSPLVAQIERSLVANGILPERRELTICPYIPLPKTYDEYIEHLPAKRRKFARKCVRDYEKWAPDHHLVVAHDEAGLAEGQRILQSLHGTRWAEAGESGVFASGKFGSFHQRLMRELLARGALQLAWLVGQGRPLAIVYNFVWKGRVHSYQSGRAVDLQNSIRVGIVSHLKAIELSIAAGHSEYDFLAGRQRYKLELSTVSRPLVAIHAWRRPWMRLAQLTLDRGIDQARELRQRWHPDRVVDSTDEEDED